MGLQGYNPNELVEILTPYFCRRDDGCLTFTPGYFTADKWDGDAKNGASGIIDLSAVFGVPAGVKAVALNIWAKDETTGVHFGVKDVVGTTQTQVISTTQVANLYIGVGGICPCDSNGDIYFTHTGELDGVWIVINGYWS